MKDAAAYAATLLRLPDDWLNNAVGGFTPESESDDFFLLQGDYPRGDRPGLKVFMAKPEYLCAMKLKALTRASFEDRDFNDLVELASSPKPVLPRRSKRSEGDDYDEPPAVLAGGRR
jgi:hypothetical protein